MKVEILVSPETNMQMSPAQQFGQCSMFCVFLTAVREYTISCTGSFSRATTARAQLAVIAQLNGIIFLSSVSICSSMVSELIHQAGHARMRNACFNLHPRFMTWHHAVSPS